jgi:hypothetical protein
VASLVAGRAGSRGGAVGETLVEVDNLGHLVFWCMIILVAVD